MAFPSQGKSVQQQQVFRLAIAYLEGWQKNPVEINRNPTAGSNPDLRPNSHRDEILNDSPHSIRNLHSVGLGESGHLDVLHLNILTAWRNSHHFALVADQAAIVIFDDFSEGIMIPVAFIGARRFLDLNWFVRVSSSKRLSQCCRHIAVLFATDV
jgi:hypothetical protein